MGRKRMNTILMPKKTKTPADNKVRLLPVGVLAYGLEIGTVWIRSSSLACVSRDNELT